MKVLILTDLHYVTLDDGTTLAETAVKGTSVDPMIELKSCLNKICNDGALNSIDLILCPGDITTRADRKAFEAGWSALQDLGVTLDAQVIAATGNHEVCSRADEIHKTPGNVELAVEPWEFLLKAPGYPAKFQEPQKKWVYWGRGYEIVEGSNFVVVIVNTCHYHSSLLANEYERGRISEAALDELGIDISRISKKYKYRFVLLHHPPLPHEESTVDLGRTPMFNGAQLLQILQESNHDWVVVHGHKHFHRLVRSSGADYSPFVLGAGSFGAHIVGGGATKTKNQFHILDLSLSNDEIGEERVEGKIQSFYWTGSEWRQVEEMNHGLPNGCGFSWERVNPSKMAAQIKDFISESEDPYKTWEAVVDEFEYLQKIMPSDIPTLLAKLERVGVDMIDADRNWFPRQLSVKK